MCMYSVLLQPLRLIKSYAHIRDKKISDKHRMSPWSPDQRDPSAFSIYTLTARPKKCYGKIRPPSSSSSTFNIIIVKYHPSTDTGWIHIYIKTQSANGKYSRATKTKIHYIFTSRGNNNVTINNNTAHSVDWCAPGVTFSSTVPFTI